MRAVYVHLCEVLRAKPQSAKCSSRAEQIRHVAPLVLTYKVTVSYFQGLVDTIADLARSGLPGTVSQLTVCIGSLAKVAAHRSCHVRDLVASVEGDGLSGRHGERCKDDTGRASEVKRVSRVNLFQAGLAPLKYGSAISLGPPAGAMAASN